MKISNFVLLLEALSKDSVFRKAFESFVEGHREIEEFKKKLGRKETLSATGQTVGRYSKNPQGFLKYVVKNVIAEDVFNVGLAKLAEDIDEIIGAEIKVIYTEWAKIGKSKRSYKEFLTMFSKDFKMFIEQDKNIYADYPGIMATFDKAVQSYFSGQVVAGKTKSGKDFELKVIAYLEDVLKTKVKGEPQGSMRFPDGEILGTANATVLKGKSIFEVKDVWFEVKEGRQTSRNISSNTIKALYEDLVENAKEKNGKQGFEEFDPKSNEFWKDFALVANYRKRLTLTVLGLSYKAPAKALYFIDRVDGKITKVKRASVQLWTGNNKFFSTKLALLYGVVGKEIFGLDSTTSGFSPNYTKALDGYLQEVSTLSTKIIESY